MTPPRPCICGSRLPNAACAQHGEAADRAGYPARLPDDLTIDGPWVGPDEPPPLEPDAAPGGVVIVHRDADDAELCRWPLVEATFVDGIAEASAAAAAQGGTIVAYDGDSGLPIFRLATREPSEI